MEYRGFTIKDDGKTVRSDPPRALKYTFKYKGVTHHFESLKAAKARIDEILDGS